MGISAPLTSTSTATRYETSRPPVITNRGGAGGRGWGVKNNDSQRSYSFYLFIYFLDVMCPLLLADVLRLVRRGVKEKQVGVFYGEEGGAEECERSPCEFRRYL